jgi:uncharacterized protein YjiS (DUF1127 family)
MENAMQLARNAMSASALSNVRSERVGVLGHVKNVWSNYVETASRRDEHRATIEALAALDDAALADIGLHRSQIWSIAGSLDERSALRPR